MKDTDLELFRHLLTQWMEELLDQRNDTVEGLLDSRENWPDPLDRAFAESERAWTLRIRGRESMLIKKIRHSLEAIESKDMVSASIAVKTSLLKDWRPDLSHLSAYLANPKENRLKNLLEHDARW